VDQREPRAVRPQPTALAARQGATPACRVLRGNVSLLWRNPPKLANELDFGRNCNKGDS
jgi:hypothetical protein